MTTLRALVGACFLLAVIGTVVAVTIGWSLFLGIIEVYPEKINQVRLYQPKAELGQKKILPRTTYNRSGTRLRRSRSEKYLSKDQEKYSQNPLPSFWG